MRYQLDGAPDLPISCDAACHRDRPDAIGGATDWVVGVGTPIHAMFDGMVRYRIAGTGGWALSLISDRRTGHVAESMHTSFAIDLVLGGTARHVHEGDVIGGTGGTAGAPGAGNSDGPHLHAHVEVDGVRMSEQEYFAQYGTSTAGDGSTPLTEQEEETMRPLAVVLNQPTSKLHGVILVHKDDGNQVITLKDRGYWDAVKVGFKPELEAVEYTEEQLFRSWADMYGIAL